MKRIFVIFISLLVWFTTYGSTLGQAQGFSSVLDKLDKMEARLNTLEQTQLKDFSTVRKQLSEIPPVLNLQTFEVALAQLQTEVDRLAGEQDLIKGNPPKGSENQEMELLTADLRSVLNELRRSIDNVQKPSSVPAPEPKSEGWLSGIQISGFGDFSYATHQNPAQDDDYQFGQVEVDLEKSLNDRIVIGAAVAYDSDNESFGLGAFTVDFHLFGSEGEHFHPVHGIDHSGIIVGQFDIPFGIDWHVYPSIDRKLISMPQAVENTHDAWSDYGVQGYMENAHLNAVVFATNGFGYNETSMNMALGGRVGFKPWTSIEVGGSFAGFLNQDNQEDMDLIGADAQISYHQLSLKGEYIVHRLSLASNDAVINQGFYTEGIYDFGKYFLVGRYGKFFPAEEGAQDQTQTNIGAGWVILEGCELRAEYQANFGKEYDAALLQLVVGF